MEQVNYKLVINVQNNTNKLNTRNNIGMKARNKSKLLTIRLSEEELLKAKKKGRGNVSYWIRSLINK